MLETLRVPKKGGTFAIHDLMSERRYGDMQAFVQKLREMGYERVELIDTTKGKFMPPKEAKRLMSDLLIELSCMQDWPEHYFGAVFDCEEKSNKHFVDLQASHTEFEIFKLLAKHPGIVFSKGADL